MHPPSVKQDPATGNWTRKCITCGIIIFHEGPNSKGSAVAAHFARRECLDCSQKRAMRRTKYRAGEKWKPIEGFPNYSVSNFGNVKNNVKNCELRKQQVSNRRQYHMVRLYNDAREYQQCYVHRLVAEAFNIPKAPDSIEINHIDNNPMNNHVDNLQYCSHHMNRAEASRLYHEGHPNSRKQGRPFKCKSTMA